MAEEPKSIWKKSWTGWHGLLLWMATLTAAIFLLIVILELLIPGRTRFSTVVGIATKVAVLVGICGVLAVAFVRWLFCWRNFKRFLFGCACFATLIALFYAEEDWRGWHDWNKFKHAWEVKGEHFDFASVVPPSMPDDENFAMAPIWVESIEAGYGSNVTWQWYGKKLTAQQQSNLVDRLNMPLTENDSDWPTNGRGNWQKATLTNFKPWQDYYRNLATKTNEFPIAAQPQSPAADVFLALSKYDSTIEELREASQRPYSRFPINYENQPPAAILLPHLAALKRCIQILQLRMIAELQNNESQKALDDVKLSLRLIDSIRAEPFLISHLMRIAMLQITLQPIYEGLAEHKWSDAQLVELNLELSKLDFLADYELSIRSERALEIANIEFLRHPRNSNLDLTRPRFYFIAPFFSLFQFFSNMSGSGTGENSHIGFQTFALGIGPSGWINQNELRMAQFNTKWYLPIVDQETQTVSPARTRAADTALGREIRHRTPENVLETLFLPGLGNAAKKFAWTQSSVDLARVAIALERYRLAGENYPDSLDAIAAQFPNGIPHDIINGQPLKYRRNSNGQFVLYSVGWNERDDGGVVVSRPKSQSPDISQGDWVWRYPQK